MKLQAGKDLQLMEPFAVLRCQVTVHTLWVLTVTASSPLKSRLPARGWMPAPSLNWPDAVQRVHDAV